MAKTQDDKAGGGVHLFRSEATYVYTPQKFTTDEKYAGIRPNGERELIPPTRMGLGCHGWYDCGNLRRHLFKFYQSIEAVRPENADKGKALLHLVAQNLPEALREPYQALEVVRLTVVRKDEKFRVVTTPVWRHDMMPYPTQRVDHESP